jgi:hypothetical protein
MLQRGNLHLRPTAAIGQASDRCIAASLKQPFGTLSSILVGSRSAERTFRSLVGGSRMRMPLRSDDRAEHNAYTDFHVGRIKLTLARENPVNDFVVLAHWPASIVTCLTGRGQE